MKSLVAAALTAAALMLAPVVPAVAEPGDPLPTVAFQTLPDPLSPYRGQVSCDPVAKSGTVALARMVVATYGVGSTSGITRSCSSGGASEHKEGRAWDWMLSAADPAQRAIADRFLQWLTGPDGDGVAAGNARRLGIMYAIWNGRVWKSYRANDSQGSGWETYSGSSPHTDHIHISLSWDGAYQRTSWWTGKAITQHDIGPCRVYVGEPAPPYSGPRYTPCPPPVERWPIEEYVTQVYQDLFGRTPDATGLATWTSQLRAGTPRVAVSNAITSSTEFRARLINDSYARYLGRRADAEGLQTWLQVMRTGGTIQQMESGFLASAEYWMQARSDARQWVRELYADVLGRSPAEVEVAHWVSQLERGTRREQVAMGFLLSTERLTTVVDGYYRWLLDRGIDPAGRQSWVSGIQQGRRNEEIIGAIVASEEYLLRVSR